MVAPGVPAAFSFMKGNRFPPDTFSMQVTKPQTSSEWLLRSIAISDEICREKPSQKRGHPRPRCRRAYVKECRDESCTV